jgi:hypothetical protein
VNLFPRVLRTLEVVDIVEENTPMPNLECTVLGEQPLKAKALRSKTHWIFLNWHARQQEFVLRFTHEQLKSGLVGGKKGNRRIDNDGLSMEGKEVI